MSENKRRKYLPYVIVIFILTLVILLVCTYILYLIKENNGCKLNRKIWCYTDFKCEKCEKEDNCEENIKSLISPESRLAQFCYGGEQNSNVTDCLCSWLGNTSQLGSICASNPRPVPEV